MDVDETPERWKSVGEAIASRIDELNLLQVEVLRMANISDKTLTGYIDGKPIRRVDKRRGLCRALGWSDDSIARLLRGESPIVVERAAPDRTGQTDLASRVAALDPEDQRYIDGIIDALERKKSGG